MKDDTSITKDNVLEGPIENKLHSITPYQRELCEQVRFQPLKVLEAGESLGKEIGANSPSASATPPSGVRRTSLEDQLLAARLRARFARNVQRDALWHVVHALTPEYRLSPTASLILPDEHKKGPASAKALIQYARSSGISIRSLERLTALALRLTRQKAPQAVKTDISNLTEMGHSNQVRCLTRLAYRTETVVVGPI